jgi:hypothetical protein
MLLDIFKSDAFSLVPLTNVINDIPRVPTMIGDMGLFSNQPVDKTTVAIERQKDVLTLVPSAPRGAPGVSKGVPRRNLRNLETTHLPQRVSLMADEVQNLRAFGKMTEEEVAMDRLRRKMVVARRDNDITIEYQRMGAIKGQVLDADGSVLTDMNVEFGAAVSTFSMTLSNTATKVLQKVVALLRLAEDKLGGLMASGYMAMCSPEFMDAFTGHPVVQDAYRFYLSNKLSEDYRAGFSFGGVLWFENRSSINGTRFIAAGKAYLIPQGVPDLFTTFYAPAPYMDTVNTPGLPYYASQEIMDHNTGVEVQVQSNPLHICTRPDAVVEIDMG